MCICVRDANHVGIAQCVIIVPEAKRVLIYDGFHDLQGREEYQYESEGLERKQSHDRD
jgi:hypothetical protein